MFHIEFVYLVAYEMYISFFHTNCIRMFYISIRTIRIYTYECIRIFETVPYILLVVARFVIVLLVLVRLA